MSGVEGYTAKISIDVPKALLKSAQVQIDGEEVGSVPRGGTKTFEVTPGEHTIAVNLGQAKPLPLTVDLVAGRTTRFEACFRNGGVAGYGYVATAGHAVSPELPPRRAVILVVALLGFFGILAYRWANEDLDLIERGKMDPSARGVITVGKWLGLASFVISTGFVVMLFVGLAVG